MRVRATFAALALLLNVAFCARLPFPLVLRQDVNYLQSLARDVEAEGAPRVPPEFNINSGGPAVGRFVAEEPQWIVGETNTFGLEDVLIGGAEEKNLPMYKTHRFGVDGTPWGYDIPVMEPGTYGCTVHFAELHSEAFKNGARVFDLYMATSHGDPVVFKDIDIYKELNGAEFTVLTKTPTVELVIPGVLAIRVNPSAGDAVISGITCERTGDLPSDVEPDYETDPNIPIEAVEDTDSSEEPSTDDDGVEIKGTEININVGGPAVGRFLAEHYSWIRGKTSFWGGPPNVEIGGAEDKNKPALISHRYGVDGSTWGYIIPVDMSGQYHCTLHFAETDSASFKVGARVFNIMLQDQEEKDFDAFRESGEAPFTSAVKTFFNVSVDDELFIGLEPVNGNAFLSAITCERIGDLIGTAPSLPTPSPEPDFHESPLPEDTPGATEPVPTSTPVPSTPSVTVSPSETPVVETPTAEPSSVQPPGPAPSPYESEEPTAEPPVTIPAPTDDGSEPPSPSASPIDNVEPDPPLEPMEGEEEQNYDMLGRVSGDGVFTDDMKSALKGVSEAAADMSSRWAVTEILQEVVRPLSRQDTETRNYRISMQAIYQKESAEQGLLAYKEFIEGGDAKKALVGRGIDNLDVEFRAPPSLPSPGPGTASTNTTSRLVGGIIGGVLGLLGIVAIVVFFVVRQNRRNDLNTGGFDGPPPAMTESEMSSVMERAESVNSIEYHDDDSTFTAATSRAGEHVDQVAFDKDVFGRGTAAGAHGTS